MKMKHQIDIRNQIDTFGWLSICSGKTLFEMNVQFLTKFIQVLYYIMKKRNRWTDRCILIRTESGITDLQLVIYIYYAEHFKILNINHRYVLV